MFCVDLKSLMDFVHFSNKVIDLEEKEILLNKDSKENNSTIIREMDILSTKEVSFKQSNGLADCKTDYELIKTAIENNIPFETMLKESCLLDIELPLAKNFVDLIITLGFSKLLNTLLIKQGE